MTQEDKELLLKYLCMALPYGVKVYCGEDFAMTLKQIDYNCFCECWENEDLKCNSRWMLPYLRPMSSMNLDECCELEHVEESYDTHFDSILAQINWCLKKHFDFMGLIPKGLAIEVTESNNIYKD